MNPFTSFHIQTVRFLGLHVGLIHWQDSGFYTFLLLNSQSVERKLLQWAEIYKFSLVASAVNVSWY